MVPLKINPTEIIELLNSEDPTKINQGYQAFLHRTHWSSTSTPDDLKEFACNQLHINPYKVIATLRRIEPALLWASQDGLETEKLKMVEAAHKYFSTQNEDLPPIVVWSFFDSQKMRYVVHDGHHRSYFCNRFQIKLKAVILEPIGNYSEVEDKFRYAFQISLRVIDLPVVRHGCV